MWVGSKNYMCLSFFFFFFFFFTELNSPSLALTPPPATGGTTGELEPPPPPPPALARAAVLGERRECKHLQADRMGGGWSLFYAQVTTPSGVKRGEECSSLPGEGGRGGTGGGVRGRVWRGWRLFHFGQNFTRVSRIRSFSLQIPSISRSP